MGILRTPRKHESDDRLRALVRGFGAAPAGKAARTYRALTHFRTNYWQIQPLCYERNKKTVDIQRLAIKMGRIG
jgi:hypothetical protein